MTGTARPLPVAQRRGTKANYYARASRPRLSKSRRQQLVDELRCGSVETRTYVAATSRIQIRLQTAKDISIDELAARPVTDFAEVRRPAGWAKHSSPSGLYPMGGPGTGSGGYAVWHESAAERDHLAYLDWRGHRCVATQPIHITWTYEDLTLEYTPDVLVQLPDGRRVLAEVRPVAQRHDPGFKLKAILAATTVARAGWTYEIWDRLPAQLAVNVWELHAYRRLPPIVSNAIRDLACLIGSGELSVAGFARRAEAKGIDMFSAVGTTLWHRWLYADLRQPLTEWMVLSALPHADWLAEPWRTPIAADPVAIDG